MHNVTTHDSDSEQCTAGTRWVNNTPYWYLKKREDLEEAVKKTKNKRRACESG